MADRIIIAHAKGRVVGRVTSALFLCTIAVAALTVGCRTSRQAYSHKASADRTIRAIWVTRWDYKSPRDISKIMKNCKDAGFNTVLFQVRGNGTAFYRSRIEPWADELGGRDPGFDPLKVACREAHRRGLSIHAWVNVMPGWRGNKPPTNPRQLYHAKPDWFWRDAQGRRQPLGWYASLNPCYREVRQYLVDVMREIVERYAVDGLHMDYIRFPNEWSYSYPRGALVPDYPRDPRTLAMFRHETGHTPQSSPLRWSEWRTEKVTQVVVAIRSMMTEVDPQVSLSAAVGPVPDRARQKHFQDVRKWLAMGLLDAVYPMNYENDVRSFTKQLDLWLSMRPGVPVVMGVMFDKRSSATVVEQLNRISRSGSHFAAFAYNSLFERLDEHGRATTDAQSRSREDLRRRVIPHIRRAAAPQA